MTRYAIAPNELPDGADHLTPGKRYEVFKENDISFHISSDEGGLSFCLKVYCAHIEGDWTIVDGDADEATP